MSLTPLAPVFSLVRRLRGCAALIALWAGLAVLPAASATLSSQAFGNSQVGTPVTVSISISGVSSPSFSLQYSSDYSLGSCTPSGNTCSLAVTFTPVKPGLRRDAVIVKDNGGQVVEKILLYGIALGPLPVFSPALATFQAVIATGFVPFGITGLTAEPDGKILVLAASTIYEFDPATTSMTAIPGRPAGSNNFPGLSGLAADAAGNVYYENLSSGLHRLDRVTGTDSIVAGTVFPATLAIAPTGTLFYSQGSRVYEIDPNTAAITPVAGTGTQGYSGDGGPALNAEIGYPDGLAVDASGNVYISDTYNQRVRKVNTIGIISTVAGNGTNGYTGDGGPAIDAELAFPSSLQTDAAGDIYVGVSGGQIRRIDAGSGLISTIAGANAQNSGISTETDPFTGVGSSGSAQEVGLYAGGMLAIDGDSNLWIGTGLYPAGQALYEITTAAYPVRFPFTVDGQTAAAQTVSLLNAGTEDLTQPALATSGHGAADFTPTSNCSGPLPAGSACTIGITFTAGADAAPTASVTLTDNASPSPQTISVSGASGGPVPATQQLPSVSVGSSSGPQSVSLQFSGSASGVTASLAYGTEFSLGQVSCSGSGTVSCTAAVTFTPLYPGPRHDAIRFLNSSGDVIYECFLTAVGNAPQALFDPGTVGSIPLPLAPTALAALDAAGSLYAIPGEDGAAAALVYRLNRGTTQWSIVAGETSSFGIDTGDGGPATSATLSRVQAVALDPAGNMYIGEFDKVRRVDGKTGTITTVSQEDANSIAIDAHGVVYLLNTITSKVRKLDPFTGVITDYAGNGQGYVTSGDGGPATSASLNQPQAITFDNNGNLLIAQSYGIRKVDAVSGIITTYANTCSANSITVDAAGDLILPCGDLTFVPAGLGTPTNIENLTIYNLYGPILRGPDGTIYDSGGSTLTPSLLSSIGLPEAIVHGTPVTTAIGLIDTGNVALGINSINLSSSEAAEFSETSTCGHSLGASQACSTTVTFAPVNTAPASATLTFSFITGNSQTTLTGTGEVPAITINPTSLDFGSVYLPYSRQYSVALIEAGTLPVNIASLSISGPNASDFSVQDFCQEGISNYDPECFLYVTFQPVATGARFATLVIDDDAAGAPHRIPLSGIGQVASAAQIAGELRQISVGADGSLWGVNANGAIYSYDADTANWFQAPGTLAHVSVGSSQFVWGLNSAGQIYRWNWLARSWDSIPGNLAQISVGADGEVWGLNAQGLIYRFDTASNDWQHIDGNLQQIAVGFDGAVWGINGAHNVYHYNPGSGSFEHIPGTLFSISVGADGDVWGIGSNQSIYRFEPLAGSFEQQPGALAQISVGGNGNIWGLSGAGYIYQYNASNQGWTLIPGTLASIAAGADGAVWGLNSGGGIYEFTGVAHPVNSLQQLPGALAQVSVGIDGTTWGLNSAGQIFTFDRANQAWIYMPGQLAQIAVANWNQVWGLNSAGQIYRYDPARGDWDWIAGTLAQIAVAAKGDVWGLNATGQIYRFDPANQGWTYIPGQLKQLSIGADGTVWGINNTGQIYSYDAEAQGWTYIPGILAQVAVGSISNVWGVNAQGYVFQYNALSESWQDVPGVTLAQIAVGFDGAVWGTAAGGQVYNYDSADGNWNNVGESLSTLSVASDAAIWGTGADGGIYVYR